MAVYESKKITKDGRKYFFRVKYKDIFGKTHDYTSQKYKKKSDAITEEAIFRSTISEKKSNSSITISEIFCELVVVKQRTCKRQSIVKIKNQFKYLKPLENLKINDINLSRYNAWINYLDKQNINATYKNKILGVFKQIIKYSNKYYNTNADILKFVENFKNNNIIKEMDFFTLEEFKLFESVINEEAWKTFFEILYYLGLRQGEAQALTWKDISFKDGTITVNKTLTSKIKGLNWEISTPKTKSSIRTLPVKTSLLERLKRMNNEASQYKDYKDSWFVFGNSVPFKESTIATRKNKYCSEANLRQIRIHDFRHSCASLLINNGASITLVSKYLGHSKISMTLNTYTHMYKSELENVVSIINKI